MKLTRRGRVLAAAAVLLAAAGRFFSVIELFMSAGGVVVLLAGARSYVRLTPVQMTGERRLRPQRPQAGDPLEVRVELRNNSKRSAPALFATDRLAGGRALSSFPVEPLAPGATVRTSYTMSALGRGRHEVGPLTVTLRDPFGLVERSLPVAAPSTVTVVPRRCQVDASGLQTIQRSGGAIDGRSLRRVGGGEFRALRDYRSGDELRTVCWKGSARRGTLVVREGEDAAGAPGRVTILLDDRRHLYRDADFEQAVSAAASIACIAAHLGAVQLACGGVVSGVGAGPSQVEHMLEILATVQLRPAAEILRLNRLNRTARMGADVLVVVTTTSVSGADLAGVTRALGRPGLVVVVVGQGAAGPAGLAPELPPGARLVAITSGALEAAWARAVPTVPQAGRRPPAVIGRR